MAGEQYQVLLSTYWWCNSTDEAQAQVDLIKAVLPAYVQEMVTTNIHFIPEGKPEDPIPPTNGA